MKKLVEIAGIVGVLVAILVLLFGDNWLDWHPAHHVETPEPTTIASANRTPPQALPTRVESEGRSHPAADLVLSNVKIAPSPPEVTADESRTPARQPTGPEQALSPVVATPSAEIAAGEQALEHLDDQSPLVRASSLKGILRSGDEILIDLASKRVLAGSDDALKAQLIRQRISEAKRLFVLTLLDCGDRVRHKTDYCSGALRQGTTIPVFFKAGEISDQFYAYSSMSGQNNGIISLPVSLSGTALAFRLNLEKRQYDWHDCSVTLSLAPSTRMEGQMECYGLVFHTQMSML